MHYGLMFGLWIREVVKKKCDIRHIFKIALKGKFRKLQKLDLDLGHDLATPIPSVKKF